MVGHQILTKNIFGRKKWTTKNIIVNHIEITGSIRKGGRFFGSRPFDHKLQVMTIKKDRKLIIKNRTKETCHSKNVFDGA